ncbi:enzymatic polyprotein endonuclease reverse [Pelomyxa schiedti]|nr:enzymatic polyprotein endonuclease reverse [Pelomyxa schiedti]
MNIVLSGLLWEQCLVYIDDILIFGRTLAEHNARLHEVLVRLDRANLHIRLSKCDFAKVELQYLGHMVSPQGIRINPTLIQAVADFPRPQCVKDVQSFLGLAGFSRRFIQGFAAIARPLIEVGSNYASFRWEAVQEKAFQALRSALVSAPILGFPDMIKPFCVESDASGIGVGATLYQVTPKGRSTIAYWSRVLSCAERNYDTRERECLAAVEAIKHWRQYLHGATVTLYTDHAALKYLMEAKNLTGRLARWALTLLQYNAAIQHRPGKALVVPHTLSHYPQSGVVNFVEIGQAQQDLVLAQSRDTYIQDIRAVLEGKEITSTDARWKRELLLTAEQFLLGDDNIMYRWSCPWSKGKTSCMSTMIHHMLEATCRLPERTIKSDDDTGGKT